MDLALSAFLVAAVFAAGLVAVLDRELFAAVAGWVLVFSAVAFSGATAGGDLMAAALVAEAALVAAGAAGWAFALTGPDMVTTAVVMVTTRATESRRTRFMGVFFLRKTDTTGKLYGTP